MLFKPTLIAVLSFLLLQQSFSQQADAGKIKTTLCKTWSLDYKTGVMEVQPTEETEYPTIHFLTNGGVEIKTTDAMQYGSWELDSSQHVVLTIDQVRNVFKVSTLSDEYVQLENMDPLNKQKYIKLFNIK